MAVTITNLVMGPGTLWIGAFGVTEPAGVATPGTGWVDLGATMGGTKLTIKQTYTELDIDQTVDVAGRRLTKREIIIDTNLAEITLENLANALNEAAPTAAATGLQTFTPSDSTATTQPLYHALLFDGWAPSALGVNYISRLIVRKALQTKDVSLEFSKKGQTNLSATFEGHYVSASIKPFVFVNSNGAA
jgi:hypothetical protein